MSKTIVRRRETTSEWFRKPLDNPHPAYFERQIYTTDTPEYKLMTSLRRRIARDKRRLEDRRTVFIDPRILTSFTTFVSAVGRAPDPRHRPRLIERKKGWVAGNVCWVIPDENEHGATFEDLTGFVFGQYTVIGPHKHTSTGTRWWARCSCSKEFWISTSRLRKLENPKCKSCAARERTEKFRLRGLNPNGKPFAIKKPRERKIKEKKEKVTGISLSQTMEYLRWMQIKRSAQQATEAVRTRRIYGPDIVASFSTFLEAVGKCPDGCAVIRLKDKKIGYVSGNMYWGPK